tara:strand:+ start:4136 stop:4444 length:309 start_codon:yes stop_codon:yes gene_type:complete
MINLWVVFGCCFFAILSGVLAWYIRELMKPLRFFHTNVDSIKLLLDEYLSHLERVYSMDVFYGDETLRSLIEHTKFLSAETQKYKELFMFEENETNETEEKI